ncbi:MAG TPA: response regulator [Planctomycetota bacterium]|nr:response regulator [Planctomycetota bacterium]
MRLEEIEVPLIEKAVAIYLDRAWAGGKAKVAPDFSQARHIGDALELFQDEKKFGRMRKWTLRLGNRRYPFMKLVLQELLTRDRFFFSVDTHDDLDLGAGCDDFERFVELKRFNAELKEEVENAWREARIPTFAGLVADVEAETRVHADLPHGEGRAVFVVDDDADLVTAVSAVMTRQGYRVSRFGSAEEAVDALKGAVPDLILSDLEMPGMSGIELGKAVRADARLKDVPFILATGAGIDAAQFTVVDAWLVKPFETSVLLKFAGEAIAKRRAR